MIGLINVRFFSDWSAKKLIVLFLVVGLLIRFVLMPFLTYDFDIYHWAVIIQNIDSGNNLYDLAGYYYTPVWGYIMGFISMFKDLFLNIGTMGMTFVDMLPIESLNYPYHVATITSIGFNIMMKFFLVIIDVIVGYMVYRFVMDRTGNERKAAVGFGLWFLCPIVLYMSSVQGMFDTISAMLLLLTVFMLYRDRCFFAGAFFATAVLLKFFPAFCLIVLVGYLYAKHRDDGQFMKKFLLAMAGALVMLVVLMLPQMIEGQLYDALSFIIGRASTADLWKSLFTAGGIIIALAGMLGFGYLMFRTKKEDADDALMRYVLLSAVCAVLMSITPQYIIVFIPFFITYLLSVNGSRRLFWIISVAAFAGAIVLNNFSLFCSLSEYTSLVSAEWVISSMQALEGTLFGFTYVDIINCIANLIQYIGTILMVVLYFADAVNIRWPKVGRVLYAIRGGERHEIGQSD